MARYIKILSFIFLLTIGFVRVAFATPGWKSDGKIISSKLLGKKDGVVITQITYMSQNLKVKGLLFVPCTSQKLPLIVFCHDGISGISKEHRLASIRLAKEGYAVFSPSYRGEDGSEGEIEIAKGEVLDVINGTKAMSSLKGIDKNRIAIIGASHGALIAVLAASRYHKYKALVEAYGVMDIYKWWEYLKKHNMIGKDKITKRTYGKGPKDRPRSFYIRNAVTYAKNIKCPVLILQGKKDKIVPYQQAIYLKRTLAKYKIPHEMIIYPNCLHGFLVYAPYLKKGTTKEEKKETEQAWKKMLLFLKRNLR